MSEGDATRIQPGLVVNLGTEAKMVFLYANGVTESDPNENSLVVRLDLGSKRVLFMGDAGGGERRDPSELPDTGSIEAQLLAQPAEVDADVLIVGHHGSETSSRSAFLDAVSPEVSIISSGPMPYNGVVHPDQVIVDELSRHGQVFRTDLDDDACGTNPAKVGSDSDGRPGGCDSVKVTIGGEGVVTAEYLRIAD